jgi:protein-disulfide isomerase
MHANARKAAEVLTCAGRQDRFWFMHDKLFESQRRVQIGDWIGMAKESGMDLDLLKTCLASPDIANTWMADQKVAESYGIQGTPALFINGRFFNGAVPLDMLSQVIEEEIGRATATTPAR